MEKKRNKWKIAFWINFVALIVVLIMAIILLIGNIDKALWLDDLQNGSDWTERDFKSVIKFVNETDLSKTQISKIIEQDIDFVDGKTIENDTIHLNRIDLIFKKDKLIEIKDNW